jgi:hypothetical protein
MPAAVLALVVPMASVAAPSTKSVADPAGDVVYTPIEGYTATGPPAWADLLGVTYTVSKGDNLAVTFQVADAPDVGTVGSGWSVRGTVKLADGREKRFTAGVAATGSNTSAYVGSKSCGAGSTFSAATNVVVLKVDFSPCVEGPAAVRLYGEGVVSGAKAAGKDTYYQPVYVDLTASKNLRLR